MTHINSAQAASQAATATAASPVKTDLGALPEWNLGDLYPATNSGAFVEDLARAGRECKAFAETYRGRLAEVANEPPALLEAVETYERIEDLLGRIMSYAGLVYAGDSSNPANAKFYGDAQEKITTASTDLLFFQLELNRIDDSIVDAAFAFAPLARYRPWFEDIRKEKPYELDDKLEQLFHEKSVTGRGA